MAQSWSSISMNKSEVTSEGLISFRFYSETFWDLRSRDDENLRECQSEWICAENQWRCPTGQCLPEHWVNDRDWDCPDASDERYPFGTVTQETLERAAHYDFSNRSNFYSFHLSSIPSVSFSFYQCNSTRVLVFQSQSDRGWAHRLCGSIRRATARWALFSLLNTWLGFSLSIEWDLYSLFSSLFLQSSMSQSVRWSVLVWATGSAVRLYRSERFCLFRWRMRERFPMWWICRLSLWWRRTLLFFCLHIHSMQISAKWSLILSLHRSACEKSLLDSFVIVSVLVQSRSRDSEHEQLVEDHLLLSSTLFWWFLSRARRSLVRSSSFEPSRTFIPVGERRGNVCFQPSRSLCVQRSNADVWSISSFSFIRIDWAEEEGWETLSFSSLIFFIVIPTSSKSNSLEYIGMNNRRWLHCGSLPSSLTIFSSFDWPKFFIWSRWMKSSILVHLVLIAIRMKNVPNWWTTNPNSFVFPRLISPERTVPSKINTVSKEILPQDHSSRGDSLPFCLCPLNRFASRCSLEDDRCLCNPCWNSGSSDLPLPQRIFWRTMSKEMAFNFNSFIMFPAPCRSRRSDPISADWFGITSSHSCRWTSLSLSLSSRVLTDAIPSAGHPWSHSLVFPCRCLSLSVCRQSHASGMFSLRRSTRSLLALSC